MSGLRARPRRVCVTGGLGFIGAHLCARLLERGYEVRCIDRLSGRYAPGSREGWSALAERAGFELVRADVTDTAPAPLLEGVDATIHLAARPGVRASHGAVDLWRDNVLSTTCLLEEAARRGQRLVLASTSSVYGNAARLPTPEETAPGPLNPYALAKLAAEEACRAAARQGADVVVTRLFTVYGPRQRPDMAFARWIAAIAAGTPLTWCADALAARDFTYVDDAVAGLTAALERGVAGEAYNIAGTGSRPLREALTLIEGMVGGPTTVRRRSPSPAEAVVTAACGEKAAAELGYRARVTLEEGLARQVAAATPRPHARGASVVVSARSRARKNSSAVSRWSAAPSRVA